MEAERKVNQLVAVRVERRKGGELKENLVLWSWVISSTAFVLIRWMMREMGGGVSGDYISDVIRT